MNTCCILETGLFRPKGAVLVTAVTLLSLINTTLNTDIFINSIHVYVNVTIVMFSFLVHNMNMMRVKQLTITTADESSFGNLY